MKSYYMQLKPIVLAYLEAYTTDFTVHDRKHFRENPRNILMAIRKTGTDLATNISLVDYARECFQKEYEKYHDHAHALRFAKSQTHKLRHPFLFGYNQRFFKGSMGSIKEISKREAEEYFSDMIEDIKLEEVV